MTLCGSSLEHLNTDFVGFVDEKQCHLPEVSFSGHHTGSFLFKGSNGASKAEAAARKKEIAACKANCKVPYKEGMKQCKSAFKTCKKPVKQELKSCKSGCKKSAIDFPQIFMVSTIINSRMAWRSFF
jgi:hypothetical protein